MAYTSEFWESKIKTYFSRIDVDNDRHLTRADFARMAEKFIAEGNISGEKGERLTQLLTEIWDSHISSLGERGIKKDAFVESCRKMVKDPTGRAHLEGSLANFFHAVDTDGDLQISKTEFERFYRILGLDEAMAAESFGIIDVDSDNQLSLEEFINMGLLFFTSEDESCVSKAFWGPLVTE